MKFKLFIQNSTGSEKWELPFKTFSITDELNADRNAQFTFDNATVQEIADEYGVSPEYIFSAAYREVYVYDQDDNLVYSGFIDEQSASGGKDGDSQSTVTSRGFFSLLSKRITDSLDSFQSEDMSDIAWDIIDYSQNLTEGDLGLTRGATGKPTVNRDRTFKYKNIKEAIEKLSNSNINDGFDFDVDHEKKFNVYYPTKGSTKSNIKLELGFNIESYTIRKTGILGMCNQVTVFGNEDGGDMPVEVRDADLAYKQAYFLLQETLSEKDVIEIQTLQDKGDEYLEDWKTPRKEIDLVCSYDNPSFQTFDVGDILPVVISDGAVNVDDDYRLKKRTLVDDGTVYLSLFPR